MLKDDLRQRLNGAFSDQELKRWFDPLRLDMNTRDKRLTVSFPHPFFAAWFADNMQQRFEEALATHLGNGHTVRYHGGAEVSTQAQALPVSDKPVDFPYGHQFTLENYLTNAKNEFSLNSARELCRQDQVLFNPFVICGDSGSGKTHLLRAVGNELARKARGQKTWLGSIEDLDALFASTDQHAARSHLLSHHAVLVDDVHRLADLEPLQRQFIVLFNSLEQNGKQMVFSCNGKMTDLESMDATLASRLKGGLIATLSAPDLDIRVRYLKTQCRTKRITLPGEHLLTLAQQVEDLRLLQGIVVKLVAYRDLMNRDLTEQDFQAVVQQSAGKRAPAPRPEDVIQAAASHFEVTPKEILDAGRRKPVVMARQVAMYLCRTLIRASYPALGGIFGGRDHSTVLYAVKKIEEKKKVNRDLQRLLTTLEAKVREQAAAR